MRKDYKTKTPTEIDWARLAAYIDGEGSIGLHERKRQYRADIWLRVMISNTDPRLINWLASTFGGRAVMERRGNEKHRTAFKWLVSCAHAKWILQGVLPYVLIKREQVEIGLAFQETMRAGGGRITDEIADMRYKFKDTITKLKHVRLPQTMLVEDRISDDYLN